MSMEMGPAVAADEITDEPFALRHRAWATVGATPWRRVFRRFVRNWSAMSGLVIVVLLVLTAVFASVLAPYGQDPDFRANLGPSADALARDQRASAATC